jgi:hypothetical protein
MFSVSTASYHAIKNGYADLPIPFNIHYTCGTPGRTVATYVALTALWTCVVIWWLVSITCVNGKQAIMFHRLVSLVPITKLLAMLG